MEDFIKAEVTKTLKKAEKIYKRKFDEITILFNLKGKSAGMFSFNKYTVDTSTMKFRFNVEMAKLNTKKSTKDTVVHEVGHYIARVLANGDYIKPHGKEWKGVMNKLGGNPERCHSLKVAPSSRPTFTYKCSCMTHEVSRCIHNKMLRGQKRMCKKCKQQLVSHV